MAANTEEEFIFDCDESADGGSGSQFTVPAGEYALTVWEVLGDPKATHPKLLPPWRASRNGDPQLNIRFGINGHAGKLWVYNTLTFIPKDKNGHGVIVHNLKCLGAVIKDGRLVNFKPSDLIGRVCRAELTLEQPADSKYPKNKIKNMLYAKDGDVAEMRPVAKPSSAPNHYEDVPF